jgi:hypothetical protein
MHFREIFDEIVKRRKRLSDLPTIDDGAAGVFGPQGFDYWLGQVTGSHEQVVVRVAIFAGLGDPEIFDLTESHSESPYEFGDVGGRAFEGVAGRAKQFRVGRQGQESIGRGLGREPAQAAHFNATTVGTIPGFTATPKKVLGGGLDLGSEVGSGA